MYSNEDFDEMYQNYGKLFENKFNEFFNINNNGQVLPNHFLKK